MIHLLHRLLVAASIDQSSSGSNLTLRHTTMLPNIRGLPCLVALMFCPQAELKPDSTLCHYAAILCGLGHIDGSPLYPEQDILVPIDFELDRVDLQNVSCQINALPLRHRQLPQHQWDILTVQRKIQYLIYRKMGDDTGAARDILVF